MPRRRRRRLSSSLPALLAIMFFVVWILFVASDAFAKPIFEATGTLAGISSGFSITTAGIFLAEQTQFPDSDLGRRDISIQAPPEYLTIVVVNSFGADISTSYVQGTPGPSPVSGDTNTGTMTAGETAMIAVPTGWSGNIAYNNASFPVNGDVSLLEASFVVPTNYSVAVADVDVSYVNGFTIAASCACSNVIVTGCNYDLWAMNPCPNNNGEGACTNPTRPSTTIDRATSFFEPCAGMAYTFPIDDAANSFGACQSGTIMCCIGTSCPPNPKQAQVAAASASASAQAAAGSAPVGRDEVMKWGW